VDLLPATQKNYDGLWESGEIGPKFLGRGKFSIYGSVTWRMFCGMSHSFEYL
jgi:hypothetical protein